MMPFRFVVVLMLVFGSATIAAAQLRHEEPNPYQWTGSILRSAPIAQSSSLPFGMKGFQMSHSYEMTMGTFGGQTYNQNYYTNSMALQFNDRMTGKLDVAFAHSPFGNGMMMNQGPRIFIRNAEFQYQISPKTQFSVSFQQNPWNRYQSPYLYGY
jgi:hypothetical protein